MWISDYAGTVIQNYPYANQTANTLSIILLSEDYFNVKNNKWICYTGKATSVRNNFHKTQITPS